MCISFLNYCVCGVLPCLICLNLRFLRYVRTKQYTTIRFTLEVHGFSQFSFKLLHPFFSMGDVLARSLPCSISYNFSYTQPLLFQSSKLCGLDHFPSAHPTHLHRKHALYTVRFETITIAKVTLVPTKWWLDLRERGRKGEYFNIISNSVKHPFKSALGLVHRVLYELSFCTTKNF